jgi:Organic solute transporter Ostalpha
MPPITSNHMSRNSEYFRYNPDTILQAYCANHGLISFSIIRILFMVPVFSVVSFLSYYFYIHTVYYAVLRDCYEAFAISSFFSLLCGYVAPNLHDQKEYFRSIQPRDWVWPMKWGKRKLFKTPRSGLTWFNVRVLLLFLASY